LKICSNNRKHQGITKIAARFAPYLPSARLFYPKTLPQEIRKFSRPFKGHAKNANIAARQLSNEWSFSGARAT
jgi:hypothetical protein